MTDWHDGVLCFNLIQKEREVHYWFPMSSRDPAGASPRDLQLDRRSSECRKSQLIRGGLFREINLSCRRQEWPPVPRWSPCTGGAAGAAPCDIGSSVIDLCQTMTAKQHQKLEDEK